VVTGTLFAKVLVSAVLLIAGFVTAWLAAIAVPVPAPRPLLLIGFFGLSAGFFAFALWRCWRSTRIPPLTYAALAYAIILYAYFNFLVFHLPKPLGVAPGL
jgi:hypothetical protein